MSDQIYNFHQLIPSLQSWLALVLLLLPLTLLLPAVLAGREKTSPSSLNKAWRLAQGLSLLALLFAALTAAMVGWAGAASVDIAPWLPVVRLDPLSAAMLILTTFLAWVIVRYSHHYLAGERGQTRYLAWLCLTLMAVWLLVVLNNLLLLCIAWTATSIALHQLLTFYRDRPAAILAAHKKFLISRLADLCTFAATSLIYVELGTLQIDQITQLLQTANHNGVELQIAALLFALSAILKCAQLPFHGWLLQVMEAPTPVSALLHAGIVNIGGFVLLRLSGLLEISASAQMLLVIVGSVTAALAALVMMTRISVKVSLAWSTCAQMGFMLLEIGLGAYSLALLHLLAHSLYKAHAFLAAGETVSRYRLLNIAPAEKALSLPSRALALLGLVVALVTAAKLTGLDPQQDSVIWVLGGALAASLLPLVSAPSESATLRQIAYLSVYAFALAILYGVWHMLFAQLLAASNHAPSTIALIFSGGCLLTLLIVQQIVLGQPQGRVSRWLHPRAFAGFHLDEVITYLTLRLWPVRLRANRSVATPMNLKTKEIV